MTDPYAMWDAAYVLGSLSSNERREYEEHLGSCLSCRSAVGELSGMPALLATLGPDEMAAIDDNGLEPPPPLRPQLLDDVLREVRLRRRRGRWLTWTVAGAAAAVLAVGVLLAVKPAPFGATPPQVSAAQVTMTPMVPSSFEATVQVTPMGWGTHVSMTCTYRQDGIGTGADGGNKLAMYAVGRDGSRVQLATWMAHDGATASPTGSTSMPMEKIAAVQVVSADTGDVLLQRSL